MVWTFCSACERPDRPTAERQHRPLHVYRRRAIYFFFAQVSRSVTVRLNTNAPERESRESTVK